MNTTIVPLDETARTCSEACSQRAASMWNKKVEKVMELCVGPSLKMLNLFYSYWDITCFGNDIDYRWKEAYPEGNWVIGDYKDVYLGHMDAVVFGPPLSRGCTGKREDSLMIDWVEPRYEDFIEHTKNSHFWKVMVLPGRSLSTREDRNMFYKLMSKLDNPVIEMRTGKKRGITKYIDVIWK